jgi:hypothetical protein
LTDFSALIANARFGRATPSMTRRAGCLAGRWPGRCRTSFKAALKKQPIEIADLLQILARQLGQNVQADFVLPERSIHGVPRKAIEIAVRHYQNDVLQTTDPVSGDARQWPLGVRERTRLRGRCCTRDGALGGGGGDQLNELG